MPVGTAVVKNALPAVAAMLMTLIYNLADTFFIGQTHDAYQVAAVSLATPVFLIFMAVGSIFGIGGTSVISRAIGEGKKEYAKKVCAFCMWCCVFVGILLSACILIFMDSLLKLIGASADTWEFTRTYLMIVSFSGPFALISSCFSNILRAEGQANKAMTGQIIGNLLNMVLDAVLIMVFHLDIVGCALATLIGETAGAIYYIVYFLRGKSSLSINIKDFSAKDKIASGVLAIGIPAALASILMSVASVIMNALMAEYGDMAVAGIGVAMKIVMITGMVSMGIGQGVQPLLGYCVGSKDFVKFKQYMKFSLIFATALGVVLTLFCYLFTGQIVSAFLTDQSAYEYALEFARLLLMTGPIFGIYYVLSNALQAMGAAVSSLIVNVSRQGLVYIPALFLFKAIMGADGLALAQPAADIVSLVLGLVIYIIVSKKVFRAEKIS
ncbi:MAG: MATE family efflux transporter [Roseburia sp.]|nr:MATE family efflux transporter [Roseburia sp.]